MDVESLRGREILIMDIELGHGTTGELVIHEYDDPNQIAQQFCFRNGLDLKALQVLKLQIQQNLQVIDEQLSSESMSISDSSTHSRAFPPQKIQPFQPPPQRKPQQPKPAPKQESIKTKQFSTSNRLQFSNYGQKLYFKGMKMRERTERNIQRLKQQKADRDARNLTFKPTTNSRIPRDILPQKQLLQKGKQYIQNNQKRRGQKLALEMENCTFTPQINRTSKLLHLHRNSISPARFTSLYVDAKQREFHKAQLTTSQQFLYSYKQNYPFKPDITRTEQVNTTLIDNPREKISVTRRSILQYLDKQRQIKLEHIDPESGQELFKPKIGRPPKNRQVTPATVGEHLYRSSVKKTPEPQTKQAQTRSLNQSFASKKSELIFNSLKMTKLSALFQQLKPNQQGLINKQTVQNAEISVAVRKIIEPLLTQIVKFDQELTFGDFCESMDFLMDQLTPSDRNILMQTSKSRRQAVQYPFKPKLRSKSASSSTQSLYERGVKFKKGLEDKLQVQRKLKSAMQMKGCTFHPKTTPFIPKSSSVEDLSSRSRSFFKYQQVFLK